MSAWLHSLTEGAPSYSSVVARTPYVCLKLQPVPLGSRPASQVNNIPNIMLNQTEEEQLRKQRENTLIMNSQRVTRHSMIFDPTFTRNGNWTPLRLLASLISIMLLFTWALLLIRTALLPGPAIKLNRACTDCSVGLRILKLGGRAHSRRFG